MSGAGTIPLGDAGSLRPAARRTRALRALLAAALVALVAAAALLGRSEHVERVSLLPAGTSGILVLDVSASISTDTYDRIRATLESLARGTTPFGLVVFSDVAYEALPPGTPPRELARFVRFFRVARAEGGFAPALPVSPWTRAFSGGTRISSGLAVARSVLLQEGVRRGAVLLVSDLSDAPADTARVAQELVAYRREGIGLRVVGLNPSPQDAQLFRRLLGGERAVLEARLPGEGEIRGQRQVSSSFPAGLVAAAAALLALLAANELAGARLAWRARRAPHERAPLVEEAAA